MARGVWGFGVAMTSIALACGKSTHDGPVGAGGMTAGAAQKGGRGGAATGGAAGSARAGAGNGPVGGSAGETAGRSSATGGADAGAFTTGGIAGSASAGRGGDEGAGVGGSLDECEALSQAAAKALEPVVSAHQSCESDADCATNSSLGGCYDGTFVLGGCWVPLAASGTETVSAAARDLCQAFEEAGCIGLHPCPAAPPLACQAGTCAFEVN
jgi:hypothetical protein